MNRYEIKFDISEYKIFKIIKEYQLKELHPERIIKSIYFDTINYSYFIDSEEGQTPRKKIRLRSYNLDKSQSLELKFTNSYHREKIVINNFIFSNENISREVRKFNIYDLIQPKLLVSYTRQYFLSAIGRITIDKNIKYQKVNNKLNTIGAPISDHKTILEVKTQKTNFDKSEILKFINLQESRNSKYCNGVNLFNEKFK